MKPHRLMEGHKAERAAGGIGGGRPTVWSGGQTSPSPRGGAPAGVHIMTYTLRGRAAYRHAVERGATHPAAAHVGIPGQERPDLVRNDLLPLNDLFTRPQSSSGSLSTAGSAIAA